MKNLIARTCIIAASVMLTASVPALAASYVGYTEDEYDALTETTVVQSEDSPTGYYATFRFPDDGYDLVQIYGEWSFSDISKSSPFEAEDKGPEEWEDGDTVYKISGWPTADMTLNEETDTWVYTIPLPNGTWKYSFNIFKDGSEDYTMAIDPANPPYIAVDTDVSERSREQTMTSIYVPWDEKKQAKTKKVTEEAPRDGENGEVLFNTVTLDSGITTSYGIYLPYEFDVNREEAYPILVLYHGGGGFEGSWLNNGLANIMDNMIAEGRVEPMVVVTPCGEDFRKNGQIWDREACWDYVVNTILPYMEENYNVSSDPAKRAAAGLSQGGATLMHAYFNYTDYFDYYICMSAPMREGVLPDFTKEELKDVNLYIGMGLYDMVTVKNAFYDLNKQQNETSIYYYMYNLSNAGVPYTVNMSLPYGHDWVLWRQLLVDALDNFIWQ